MAARKALHVWIDAELYDLLQKKREREERNLRDIVEETLGLGLQSQQQQRQEDHTTDQRIIDLLLTTLREAGLARNLSEVLLDYFLGPPAAQAHYERASRQIEELLTRSSDYLSENTR